MLRTSVLKVITFDRHRSFFSDTKLGVSLLESTTYRLQTDGTSERTEQNEGIALNFRVWLPTPNEVAYDFTPNKPLDLIAV